jgi:hypothetical protein
MADHENIQFDLVKSVNGERILRLTDPQSGLCLEKKRTSLSVNPRRDIEIIHSIFYVGCLLVCALIIGCGEPPNPVKGWKGIGLDIEFGGGAPLHKDEVWRFPVDKTIIEDYQAFLKRLRPTCVFEVAIYENGKGEHAVWCFVEPRSGFYDQVEYFLMYDKSLRQQNVWVNSSGSGSFPNV